MMKNRGFLIIIVGVVFLLLSGCFSQGENNNQEEIQHAEENRIIGDIEGSEVVLPGEVEVEGLGTFSFNPEEIKSIREDIFQQGHFSLFDVLLHLHSNGDIELEYEFSEDKNTYIIHSIDGLKGWWYNAYYDGGWREASVFRMDHYPYKDKMFLQFVQRDAGYLEQVYGTYEEEVTRRNLNDGKIIIPEVIIKGQNETLTFEDLEVKAHNLRNDVFREGVVTAIDVILTLGNAGEISYDLQWYDSIGSAEIVRSYWVNRINEDDSYARCGFVYEAGSEIFRFFKGNHNHIPSDVRVINSPNYLEYFWICI